MGDPRFEFEKPNAWWQLLYPEEALFDAEHNAFVTPTEDGQVELWAAPIRPHDRRLRPHRLSGRSVRLVLAGIRG